MGVVYKAYDTVTKRFVALKTLWGDAGPAAVELFEKEWTVLARLSHPNIVDILDTGEFRENGQHRPYFVMPLLPGATLDHLIKAASQRLTVERSIEIFCQACRGLQAAHSQGLIHRDLKPSNLFVMDDDTVKIIDFGVVHLADARSVTGLKGTLQYMAPEQLEMKPATALSDIFSLAVVCYETLTGRKPFARKTESEVVDAIRTHIPPPASEINGAVTQMVSRTVHKAMAKQPWHRFSNAREFGETLQKALRNETIERFDRGKIQPRIERVRKAYSEGDHQFATEILTELESEGHIDPDMSVLRIQIEQSLRQKTIRQLLEGARTRMEEEEYPLALQKIGDVLHIDPDNLDAQHLRGQIERLRGEKQIDNWFRLVSEHRDNQLYTQARQGLEEVLKIDSSNMQARRMLAEIDQVEQESIKVREEKQRLFQSAVTSYQSGEISTALSKLERVLELNRGGPKSITPDLDAQCQGLYNQVRSERDAARNAYAEGRKQLLDRNIARALEICDEYLERHPNDPMFQALKFEAEEMKRQEQSAAVAEMNRRVEAEPDLDKKFNIVKEAVERYPNEPHFKSSLKSIRDRRDLVNSIVGRARQYEERGQYNDACGQWDILRSIHPAYPGIDFELERLARRKEEQVRSEVKSRWTERIDRAFTSGEYSRARGIIDEALIEFPGDKELLNLASLAGQGVQRSAEALLLLEEGQDRCATGQVEAGLESLRKAERLDPRNATARATLLGALVQQARGLLPNEWHAAESLVKEALDLDPSDPIARNLASQIDDHRRQEAVGQVLIDARNLQASEDVPGAVRRVEEGLATYPNEVRLSQLHTTLRNLAPPAVVDPPTETIAQPAPLAFAATVAGPAAASSPAPPSSPILEPPAAAPAPPPRKPVWLIAIAAVVLAAAAWFGLRSGRSAKTPESAPVAALSPVNLISNVPGTRFLLDGKPLPASSARLAPGSHTIEAAHDGYLPESRTVTVSGAAPHAVAFTLQRALPQLLFSSAIKEGRIVLDDGEPLDLQQGSFTKDDLPAGDHSVRIFDGRKEVFSFDYHAQPGQLVTLGHPLASKNAPGVVVSSLAQTAKIFATPGMLGAAGDEAPRPIPPSGVDLTAGAQGFTRFLVNDRALSLDVSASPVLKVLLNGAPDKVRLTVAANVPDGIVIVNGSPVKRPMSGGARVLSLDPGDWTIKVAHEGYQDSEEQKVRLRAGDKNIQKLSFSLTPLVRTATLAISAAPPEAEVYIDSVHAGTVNTSGSFTKEVGVGSHTVRLSKEGFEDHSESRDFKTDETVKIGAAMKAAPGTLLVRISPAGAHLALHRDGDAAPLPIANNEKTSLRPGTYTLSADASKFEMKTETVTIEAGKNTVINWSLQPATGEHAVTADRYFENGGKWTEHSGWWVFNGKGYSFFRTSQGAFTFDILRESPKGGLFSRSRKILFVAGYKGEGDRILYVLDGRNLARRVFAGGSAGKEVKAPYALDGPICRITVEMTADSITVKDKVGKVLDSVKRIGPSGKFGFLDEVAIAPLAK
jgi:serine/threonine protein kinase/outer membrane protein assembly factor BamD (BamD/ComL family)